jgi:hypothetical protein
MVKYPMFLPVAILLGALLLAAGCTQPQTGQPSPPGQAALTTPTSQAPTPGVNLTITSLTCEMDEKNDLVVITGRVANDGTVTAKVVEVHVSLFNGTQMVKAGTSFVQNSDIPAGRSDSFEAAILHPTPWTHCGANTTYNEYLSQ